MMLDAAIRESKEASTMLNRRRGPLAPIFAFLLFAVAGIVAAQEHTKDSLAVVKEALADKKAVLMDVREMQEWDQGHLRDARLLPLSRLTAEPSSPEWQKILPKDKPVYLHCASGVRCLKAARILRQEGYDARPLKEGYKDLVKQGFPRAK
jgi:phage shock protein E